MDTRRDGVERADRIRAALLYLVKRNQLSHGDMSRLAQHFGVSRERIRQLKDEVLEQHQRKQLGIRTPAERMADNVPLGITTRG